MEIGAAVTNSNYEALGSRNRYGTKEPRVDSLAGEKGTSVMNYLISETATCSSWKMENIPNGLGNLAKEISRESTESINCSLYFVHMLNKGREGKGGTH